MSNSADQIRAAKAYVRAIRSGEGSAALRAEPFLASDVVATVGSSEITGKKAVLEHITGIWPNTAVFQLGAWSDPKVEGDVVTVEAEFPAFGAGPAQGALKFSFNAEDQIVSVSETYSAPPRPEPQKELPLVARGMINNALANGTPIVVAYTGDDGSPQLSLRGSVQVYSPTQLCAWLRSADGGLPRTLEANPKLTLLYRDTHARSTLVMKGIGRIEKDGAIRDEIFELTPEVEQLHDTARNGAALIIDLTEVRGGSPRGGVNVKI